MKKHVFNLLALLFLAGTVVFAQDEKEKHPEPKFKKSKSYSKSYSLSNSDKVKLENQFGEMKINTWDKNEIKVDVQITGKSDDEKRAQEIVDRISIEDGKQSGTVSMGIGDGLVRIAVGLEDEADLLRDIEAAIEAPVAARE